MLSAIFLSMKTVTNREEVPVLLQVHLPHIGFLRGKEEESKKWEDWGDEQRARQGRRRSGRKDYTLVQRILTPSSWWDTATSTCRVKREEEKGESLGYWWSGAYSHVVSHAVFPVDMTVKAMRNVVKVALVQATHKALGLHHCRQYLLLVSQLSKPINDQTWEEERCDRYLCSLMLNSLFPSLPPSFLPPNLAWWPARWQ